MAGGGGDGGLDAPRSVGSRTREPSARNGESPSAPAVPAESYRELVELDGAHSARRVGRVDEPGALDPDPLDLEILELVASMGHLLSSQIHRRFNPGRAMTTTQRRLKRLSDAGMLERLQFHRRDGGGVPMCCAIAPAGVRLLQAHDRLLESASESEGGGPAVPGGSSTSERLLRRARQDAHVAGWALGLERSLGGRPLHMRGARDSALSPPPCSTPAGRRALAPADLILPGGRVPHDFLRSDANGERAPVERFETVRPDATIELPGSLIAAPFQGGATALDLLVEFDDRLAPGPICGKLERYDHMLAGWALHTRRYGRRERTMAAVVFVCRDRARARECARRADALLGACRAYAGEYPAEWEYPGRKAILFAAERDVHECSPCAYGVHRLPPHVRVSIARGDPGLGEAIAQRRDLPVAMQAC